MADDSLDRVSKLLSGSSLPAGERRTAALMDELYPELRAMAASFMRGERDHHTLQATALVHEAWMRLSTNDLDPETARAEFLAAAANTMRRILIDHARRVGADKRGGGWERVTLGGLVEEDRTDIDVLALDEALRGLEELDERQARIVEMRFFGGMSGEEIAQQLGVHRNTVVRELRMARAWLARALDSE